jgi:hypothetical protein
VKFSNFPLRIPKLFKKGIFALKLISRVSTAKFANCRMVIFLKVDMVSAFLVYSFPKAEMASKTILQITLIMTIMIGAPS